MPTGNDDACTRSRRRLPLSQPAARRQLRWQGAGRCAALPGSRRRRALVLSRSDAAGLKLQHDGREILVITARSPLGQGCSAARWGRGGTAAYMASCSATKCCRSHSAGYWLMPAQRVEVGFNSARSIGRARFSRPSAAPFAWRGAAFLLPRFAASAGGHRWTADRHAQPGAAFDQLAHPCRLRQRIPPTAFRRSAPCPAPVPRSPWCRGRRSAAARRRSG